MASLLDYLQGGSKSDEFSGFYGNRMKSADGLGIADQSGRLQILTTDHLAAATGAKAKIQVAQQVAQGTQFQAEASVRTGRADNVAKMAGELQKVLDEVFAALKAERTTATPTDPDKIDPKLEPFKEGTDAVLANVRSTVDMLVSLRGKASGEQAAALDQTLKSVDDSASAVAAMVKSTWARSGSSGFVPDPTKLVDILV